MNNINYILKVAEQISSKDGLTEGELNNLCYDAKTQYQSMNGYAGLIEITVREFALLLDAYYKLSNRDAQWYSSMDDVLNSEECIPFANLTIKTIKSNIG